MSSGFAASASASGPIVSYLPSKSKTHSSYTYTSSFFNPGTISSSDFKLRGVRFSRTKETQIKKGVCNSSTRPGGPGSGDNESRSVLDAFFLGKALAEALNERIESTVGEFLSTIGRLQSEQQKQVQEFQEDVLERARRAKEKAAREAMETQGLISRSVTVGTTTVNNGITSGTSSLTSNDVSPIDQPFSADSTPSAADMERDITNQNPVSRLSNED
ncbi:uncharacterized protein At4g13200, chloroplastic [Humulus lupulus]|uniref:uncharacterized protein At4g13200, chloroplastic n=1 Tax=Humulus lupulus TaxID=3486 RepID=UPI002B40DEE1|nr:uncharacterized protein At4g13200, chloroplastic [Humulus lupulus]